ncbi:MAG: glycerophosphodiester phosphodiesterase family protein [Acholeplasma sp.]
MNEIISEYPKIKWIAHRGLPSKILENTNESFMAAAMLPFFGIETDLHLTRDQKLVLHHDNHLQRFTNQNIVISQTDYSLIDKILLNNLYKIPLFKAYLDICIIHDKHAIIELKALFTLEQINELLNYIKKNNYLSKTIIISFNKDNLLQTRKLAPNLELHYLADKFDASVLAFGVNNHIELSLHHSVITKDVIDQVHYQSLKLNAWTVNELQRAITLAKLGIDYITTDGIF